jgi:hypothetical protein
VGIVTAWKAAAAKEDGPQEAANFLVRYGLSLAAALGIYFLLCVMNVIEFTGPMVRAVLGVAGALAGALLTHHISAQLPLVGFVLGLPWLIGLFVFLGLAADLLELDMTEASLYAIAVLGAGVMLKFAVFDQM